MKRLLHIFLLTAVFCALLVAPAHALEYTFDGADNYLFGRPTSYLPGSGEYLTPNLVPGALSGGLVNQAGSVGNPNGGTSTNAANNGYPAAGFGVTVDSSGYPMVDMSMFGMSGSYIGFTEVTPSLYYFDGSLGTLKIPAIGLSVGVYEGTDSAALAKGAGHFEETSIWDGNCCFAAHNRGIRNDFGQIHTLKTGDIITLTTALGTRTYAVSSMAKVDVTDTSGLASTAENCITLYTCVADQPAYRWCVKHMFSGLLVCADCGSNLHFHFNQGNPEIEYFNCSNYKGNRGTCSSTHYIRADFLEQIVLAEITRLTHFVCHYEKEFAKLMMGFTQQAAEDERKLIQKELDAAKARDRELDSNPYAVCDIAIDNSF